jgi:hypothetical protein
MTVCNGSHSEDSMNLKSFWRGILVVVLSAALAAPARADDKPVTILIVVAATTLAAVAAILIITSVHHRHKKIMLTGCVTAGEKEMTLTDEQDGRAYALSGNTTAIKPGDRMSVQGKKAKGANKTLVWETEGVIRNFGVCHPNVESLIGSGGAQ